MELTPIDRGSFHTDILLLYNCYSVIYMANSFHSCLLSIELAWLLSEVLHGACRSAEVWGIFTTPFVSPRRDARFNLMNFQE